MEDHDFKVVRKNLNILSGLILLLAFSDAEINEINFLGIKLTLEGGRIYVGLYVLYLYFLWRFITKLNFDGDFLSEYHNYLFLSVKRDFFTEKHISKVEKNEVFLLDEFLEENPRIRDVTVSRQDQSLKQLNLHWGYLTKDNNSHTITEKIEVSRFYLMKEFMWFCIKRDKFGDYLFPILPILVNMSFFFFNIDWQGSFCRLVLK